MNTWRKNTKLRFVTCLIFGLPIFIVAGIWTSIGSWGKTLCDIWEE